MQEFNPTMTGDTVRDHTLDCAKRFKTSWVDLGRALYSVYRDKLYKTWGYGTFDAYAAKEINIRKATALKLLRSYFFLEKEEPQYLKEEYVDETDAASIPSYESVDVLRLAKNKKTLDSRDYENLKKNVFGKGKDAGEMRKDLTALMRSREELSPEEAWEKKKESQVKRMLTLLKNLKEEISVAKTLSKSTVHDIEGLIKKLESEI